MVVALALVVSPILRQPRDFGGTLNLRYLKAIVNSKNHNHYGKQDDKTEQGQRGEDAKTFELRRRICRHGHNPSWGSAMLEGNCD